MLDQQEHQELEERTYEALIKAASVLSPEELSVLCFHAGISYKNVLEAASEKVG